MLVVHKVVFPNINGFFSGRTTFNLSSSSIPTAIEAHAQWHKAIASSPGHFQILPRSSRVFFTAAR